MDQTWFILAMISPLLWAICNHIDKHLLEKYFKEGGVGTLIIISALVSVLATPVFYLIDSSVLDIGKANFGILVVAAMLEVIVLWAYLNAMQKDDSTTVVLYWQLVPVFGVIAGWFFLGEIIKDNQLVAMVTILIGTTIISLEEVEGKFRFKWRTVMYMAIACAAWATELTLFKVAALEENVWRSLFWKHIILGILGLLTYILVSKYRKSFILVMRSNSVPILSANLLNEALYILGTVSYGLAVMLAPVALVLLTTTFQSIFVLLIVIFIARFIPKLAVEDIGRLNIVKTGIAICITGFGTYLLLAT